MSTYTNEIIELQDKIRRSFDIVSSEAYEQGMDAGAEYAFDCMFLFITQGGVIQATNCETDQTMSESLCDLIEEIAVSRSFGDSGKQLSEYDFDYVWKYIKGIESQARKAKEMLKQFDIVPTPDWQDDEYKRGDYEG